jgi:hypothetical protein
MRLLREAAAACDMRMQAKARTEDGSINTTAAHALAAAAALESAAQLAAAASAAARATGLTALRWAQEDIENAVAAVAKAQEVIRKASKKLASAEKALTREQKLMDKEGRKEHSKDLM